MQRLIPYLLTGLIVVFLPQKLLAEDPAGPPGPPNTQPAGPNPEMLFNRLDAKHDGFITQDKLPPDMPEMFKQLLFLADSNGDGKITLAELTAALGKHRPGPDGAPPFGRRFRDPEAQSGQMPGPPLGRRFGRAEEQSGELAGPPFGRPGPGPGVEPPQKPAGADDQQKSVLVEAYSVGAADPQMTLKVMQSLLAGAPDLRMDIDPKTNHLIVLARPAQHAAIRATLAALQKDSAVTTADKEDHPAMPGPPPGRLDGQRGWMAGPPFAGPGMGPGWMGGQAFGRPERGPGWMGGRGFGGQGMGFGWMAGPGMGHGWMGGQTFGRPERGPGWTGGRGFGGQGMGFGWMAGPPVDGPGGRSWAGPGHGPQHHLAAFEPMRPRPWEQDGPWGPPNHRWRYGTHGASHRTWQANFERPGRPWMAPWMEYGVGPRHPWQPHGQNWYQQLLAYNQRPDARDSI